MSTSKAAGAARHRACPSCNARRMAETAAHLVDHVFPPLPVRKWVLSLPKRLRWLVRRGLLDAPDPVSRSPARYLWTTLIGRLFERYPLTFRYSISTQTEGPLCLRL